jgi:hypothetical protein
MLGHCPAACLSPAAQSEQLPVAATKACRNPWLVPTPGDYQATEGGHRRTGREDCSAGAAFPDLA